MYSVRCVCVCVCAELYSAFSRFIIILVFFFIVKKKKKKKSKRVKSKVIPGPPSITNNQYTNQTTHNPTAPLLPRTPDLKKTHTPLVLVRYTISLGNPSSDPCLTLEQTPPPSFEENYKKKKEKEKKREKKEEKKRKKKRNVISNLYNVQ